MALAATDDYAPAERVSAHARDDRRDHDENDDQRQEENQSDAHLSIFRCLSGLGVRDKPPRGLGIPVVVAFSTCTASDYV